MSPSHSLNILVHPGLVRKQCAVKSIQVKENGEAVGETFLLTLKPFFSWPTMSSEEMKVPVPNLCLRTTMRTVGLIIVGDSLVMTRAARFFCQIQLSVKSALKITAQPGVLNWQGLLEKPPGCEEGHEEHLDENDCCVEGKSPKQLLVHVQSHFFNSLQKVDESHIISSLSCHGFCIYWQYKYEAFKKISNLMFNVTNVVDMNWSC